MRPVVAAVEAGNSRVAPGMRFRGSLHRTFATGVGLQWREQRPTGRRDDQDQGVFDETARSLKTADMSVPSTASGSSTAQLQLPSSTEPAMSLASNAGVARGHYGIEDVQQVHKHMIAELERHGAQVDMWLYCPYHPDGIVEAVRASRCASRARALCSGGTGARPRPPHHWWSAATAPSTSDSRVPSGLATVCRRRSSR